MARVLRHARATQITPRSIPVYSHWHVTAAHAVVFARACTIIEERGNHEDHYWPHRDYATLRIRTIPRVPLVIYQVSSFSFSLSE